MDDLIKRLTSYKTTVMGVVVAVVAILKLTGVVDPESDGVVVVETFWDGALQVLAAISGIVLIFSKDSSN